jgi:hypothetical protein
MTGSDKDQLEDWREELRRLAYSAAAHLEHTGVGDDLRYVREWMLAPKYDVLTKFDGLLNGALRTSS